MSLDARATALAGIRARHPNYDDATARGALFRLLIGDEPFRRAWPAAPLVARDRRTRRPAPRDLDAPGDRRDPVHGRRLVREHGAHKRLTS